MILMFCEHEINNINNNIQWRNSGETEQWHKCHSYNHTHTYKAKKSWEHYCVVRGQKTKAYNSGELPSALHWVRAVILKEECSDWLIPSLHQLSCHSNTDSAQEKFHHYKGSSSWTGSPSYAEYCSAVLSLHCD